METGVVSGNLLKEEGRENGSLIGNNAPRKGLSDITNLHQHPRVLTRAAKPLQPASLSTKDYIDKLQQENMMLMKVLADRNKVIELSGIELKKLRINLEKFQQQNLLLAQANSQMLAELNSGKDRLKALNHELGCKNAVLKAMQLEKAKNEACLTSVNEVRTNKCDKAGESLVEEDGEDKPCNTNRDGNVGEPLKEEDGENKPRKKNRRRQSNSLCPDNIKPVQTKEGVDNKRFCLRSQSDRFKAQEPELTEDEFDVDNTRFLASSSCVDKGHESGPISSDSSVKKEREEGSTNNKRVSLRRQSARFKAQEPEPTEDDLKVDDTKSVVPPFSDDKVHQSGPISSDSSVKNENEASINLSNEAQNPKRISVGRPLRRAVEKIQSYKEIPVNLKMRREV